MSLLRKLLVAGFGSLVLTAAGCAADTTGDDGETAEEGADLNQDPMAAPAAKGPVEFSNACRAGTSITIAAVGDVLLHSPLQKKAYAAPNGHHSLWKDVEPLITRADVTYANLEGPCADGVAAGGVTAHDPGKTFDNHVYSSYPEFNYHPSVIDALVESGVDVVSTANNHAMDRRSAGADRTVDNLHAKHLPFVGTRRSDDSAPTWYTITTSKGIRIAWVACTFSTNGIPDPKNQVLSCYDDKPTVLATIRGLAARPKDVDAVIVTPHWGIEYEHSPETKEKNLARELIDAGATAILGNHPHVTQSMEKIVAADGREAFVVYAIGNFVSGQPGLAQRSSAILYLGLTKGADGKVTINGVRHLPLFMGTDWSVRAADKASGAKDSLTLTTRLLGQWNRMGSDEEMVTNPGCH